MGNLAIADRKLQGIRASAARILTNFLWTLPGSGLSFHFDMITSSRGSIFRVTGPLCGEFTGHR